MDRRRLRILADPLLHAGFAALVLAPTVPRAGWGPLRTGVAVGVLIDLDHVVAARSLRLEALTTLPGGRPFPHNLLLATAASLAAGRTAGRRYGWAVFAGLWSHLLFDGIDDSETPLLRPITRRHGISRPAFAAALAALAAGSAAGPIGDDPRP